MTLYTAKFNRKSIISKFDHRGRKISEEIKLIEVIHTGLPAATAQKYLKDDPTTILIAETEAIDEPRSSRSTRVTFDDTKPRAAKKTAKAAVVEADAGPALPSNSYADLVNTALDTR